MSRRTRSAISPYTKVPSVDCEHFSSVRLFFNDEFFTYEVYFPYEFIWWSWAVGERRCDFACVFRLNAGFNAARGRSAL